MKNKYTIGKIAVKNGIWFVFGVILSFCLVAITIYCNDMVANAFDEVLIKTNKVQLTPYIRKLLLSVVLGLFVTFLYNIVIRFYSVKVQTEYKNRIADRIPDIEYSYFDEKGSGSLLLQHQRG